MFKARIQILEHNVDRLVLRSGFFTLTIDRQYGTVVRSGRVLARFDEIRSIAIREQAWSDSATTWTVALDLARTGRLHVGTSTDDIEASVAAAHLSTITGKAVVVLPSIGVSYP